MVERTQISAAEFFELPASDQPVELIDGEVIMSPTPAPKHQRTVARFYTLLNDLIPNGEVFFAPLEIYLDERNVPQPDLMWVAENSRCRIGEKRLEGAPDLTVEVLSPGTALYDKRTKFRLYERHGVREYWLADLVNELLEVWRLENDQFVLIGIYGEGDLLVSPVLGKQLN